MVSNYLLIKPEQEISSARKQYKGIIDRYAGKKLVGLIPNECDCTIKYWVIADKSYANILIKKAQGIIALVESDI